MDPTTQDEYLSNKQRHQYRFVVGVVGSIGYRKWFWEWRLLVVSGGIHWLPQAVAQRGDWLIHLYRGGG